MILVAYKTIRIKNFNSLFFIKDILIGILTYNLSLFIQAISISDRGNGIYTFFLYKEVQLISIRLNASKIVVFSFILFFIFNAQTMMYPFLLLSVFTFIETIYKVHRNCIGVERTVHIPILAFEANFHIRHTGLELKISLQHAVSDHLFLTKFHFIPAVRLNMSTRSSALQMKGICQAF